jgi:hypothetical protein
VVPKWEDLVRCTDAELGRLDVASVNLACARGLPGAERIGGASCLRYFDQCARAVRKETSRIQRQFAYHREAYNHSWSFFRSMVLITVLQRDIGVRYNPLLVDREHFFDDSRDVFLHPLKLVPARGHLFVRWEDAQERFNIEGTNAGMTSPPDDYYRTGKYVIAPEVEKETGLLRSQTPREELADFLVQRAYAGWHHSLALFRQ